MEDGRALVTLSCIGQLGQFGNQIFQYAFLRIFAEVHGLSAACPDWLGRHAFLLQDVLLHATPLNLPVVPDRVVLSHAGWRRWAAEREPLAGLIRANGGQPLSGKALRRDIPQVCGDSLGTQPAEAPAAATSSRPATKQKNSSGRHEPTSGGCDLWGWFQFHSSVWRPHRARLREIFAPHARLAAALEAVLERLLRAEGRG